MSYANYVLRLIKIVRQHTHMYTTYVSMSLLTSLGPRLITTCHLDSNFAKTSIYYLENIASIFGLDQGFFRSKMTKIE